MQDDGLEKTVVDSMKAAGNTGHFEFTIPEICAIVGQGRTQVLVALERLAMKGELRKREKGASTMYRLHELDALWQDHHRQSE